MAEYKHGAYGSVNVNIVRETLQSQSAIVYVGIAPVHHLMGGSANVNKPVKIQNMAQAQRLFGYDTDKRLQVNSADGPLYWTLCEAMRVHLELNGTGPIVLINAFNPMTYKKSTKTTVSDPVAADGVIRIANADTMIVDTLEVGVDDDDLVLGKDYSATIEKNGTTVTAVLRELVSGAFDGDTLSVSYYDIDSYPDETTLATAIAGSTDHIADNKGVYAIAGVYQQTGMIPSMLVAPYYSGKSAVHTAMKAASVKVNGHWDVWLMSDLTQSSTTGDPVAAAAAAKVSGGYTGENESVYFPAVKGVDGLLYNMSTLAAGKAQELLIENDDIPWHTVSNTECGIAEKMYFWYVGESAKIYDEQTVNEYLTRHGICSIVFNSGRWAFWGAHAAAYDYDNEDNGVNVGDVNRKMLYYISNDFQARRSADVDKPMTPNGVRSIVAEEQARLDALVKIGALLYGTVTANVTENDMSDIMNGDFSFAFSVTATPLAKSLTAVVNWTDEGFTTYFEAFGE